MRSHQLPDWAVLVIGVVFLLVAAGLLAFSLKAAFGGRWTTKKRVGETIGRFGAGVFAATLGTLLVLGGKLSNTAFAVAALGLLLAGIGGTLAGWYRR